MTNLDDVFISNAERALAEGREPNEGDIARALEALHVEGMEHYFNNRMVAVDPVTAIAILKAAVDLYKLLRGLRK